MHWSVGMLLHDICVFFSKGVKNETCWKLDVCWMGASHIFFFFFGEHGAVDPDDIPFMPILYLILFCTSVIIPASM